MPMLGRGLSCFAPGAWRALSVLGASLALAACGLFGDTFSFERSTPDEYAVSVGPSLVVPPNYGLRPPGTGEAPPGSVAALDEGAFSPYGDLAGETPMSPGEVALLEAAAAAQVDPNIRERISRTVEGSASGGEDLLEEILFWEGADEEPADEGAAAPPSAEEPAPGASGEALPSEPDGGQAPY